MAEVVYQAVVPWIRAIDLLLIGMVIGLCVGVRFAPVEPQEPEK